MRLLKPNWDAPANIHAYSTTREGGVSKADFAGLNLGLHVNDDPLLVKENRRLLSAQLSAPTFYWLKQTHSCTLVKLDQSNVCQGEADASWIDRPGFTSVVMTADCLPILVTDKQGSFVASIHAGWRGLCDGIIEQSISQIIRELNLQSSQLLVWLGPCIGPTAFEVGDDVRDAFIEMDRDSVIAFKSHGEKWLANLHQLAKLRLQVFQDITVSECEHCTYRDSSLFYSYRRDGQTGRLATFAWIE